jgi:hypothetical protein
VLLYIQELFYFYRATGPNRTQADSFLIFLEHIQFYTHTHIKLRASLNERSACRRSKYVHNTLQKTKDDTFKPSVGFKPAAPTIKRLQMSALDSRTTGIESELIYNM